MSAKLVSSFAVRLRDLLATIEVSSLLGAAENRLRGLGEQLQFACMALPCDEALVALELAQLGRLRVPGIATPEAWRAVDLDFLPSGTPFAYLLGGGGAFAAELESDDAMVEVLAPELSTSPRHGLFVPIRVGGSILGGAALLRDGESMGDSEIAMAERLAEVLSLTIESYRTERVLLQLFATVLPDLCAPDALTGFKGGLAEYIHQLRLSPEYRSRLDLAEAIGRVAASGEAETRLATAIIERVEGYISELSSGSEDGGDVELPYDLLSEEPGD
jgi:GAF domain-containing protein